MIPTPASSNETVITIKGVSRRFGPKLALDKVTMDVSRGVVFGLVGANGAGKTTLIRHVLGLLRPDTGSVRVFGRDPVTDPVGVLSRIGYLSEENDLPGWMRVGELIRYTRAFYPGWDSDYAEELRRQFELTPTTRVRDLSKGQRARAGLLVAIAHRPELLVLDEPSSGLDLVIRRGILGEIIRAIAEQGRTVLFSSHLLDEVERVADRVAMIRDGRILFNGELDAVKESHHRLTVRFPDTQLRPPAVAGVLVWAGSGQEWTAVCTGRSDELAEAVAPSGGRIVGEQTVSLDEIFLAWAGSGGVVRED